ncbi:glycosyltransferase family 2 protein [Shewanella sp. S1-58-MNA-CIBAN-0166]|uniref:glycosyltransferase family 2 protein n=1 Tax=Shewanella sp. S1-58-MNA-CIBAN-0166 TaxID=3140467 RepID=UPI00332C7E05
MRVHNLVSVVIPFYSNKSGLLITSVKSALEQINVNIEIIVVDDCSPLSASSELSSLNDPRIKIIRHSKNSNGGIARNTGVDASLGNFIAFLDYDDVWYKDKLIKQLSLYEDSRHTVSHPVIYSRCKIIEGDSTFIRPRREIKPNERVGDYLFIEKEIIQTSGIFLHRDTAKLVQFDDLKRHQDYQYCLSLESVGVKFILLHDITYDFIQIPKLNDYDFSINWLVLYNGYLSSTAILNFKSLVIIRSMIAHKHLLLSLKYSFINSILREFFTILILRLLKYILPNFLIRVLRNKSIK